MNKYSFILTLICVFSCNNNRTYTLSDQEIIFSIKKKNHIDSLKIKRNEKLKVFFAIDPECPLCKSYSKTMNDLYSNYQNNIDFYAFLPSPIFLKNKMEQFVEEYYFDMNVIIDTNQILTHFLNATITPECFLLDKNFNIIYQGLIDDWVKKLGRKGQKINHRYLEEAIESHLNEESININKTNAIGCRIQILK